MSLIFKFFQWLRPAFCKLGSRAQGNKCCGAIGYLSALVWNPAWIWTDHMNLGKFLNPYTPQFPHLYNMDKGTCQIQLLWGENLISCAGHHTWLPSSVCCVVVFVSSYEKSEAETAICDSDWLMVASPRVFLHKISFGIFLPPYP